MEDRWDGAALGGPVGADSDRRELVLASEHHLAGGVRKEKQVVLTSKSGQTIFGFPI